MKQRGVQVVNNCVDCKNQLRKNNKHHFRCQKCWEKEQLRRGNLSLIGGLK